MKLDLMTGPLPLAEMQRLAKDALAAGFSGLLLTEGGRTAYLSCAAAALAAPGLDILTGVAVAFPRSPMITASTAWELAEASGGRFRLGLGTQVRAHIERRYAADFDPPGPRLEEYVQAVRACFAGFRGAPMAFDGEYWKMSLLPAMWSPGPIGVADPPIDVAAVNPWMLRMAGRVADGVHVHPLNTPTYLRDTVMPNVTAGAEAGGRSTDDVQLIVPVFTVVGDTDEERSRWREAARMQVSFYGSTPNYAFIFDQVGGDGTTARIREKQKAGDIAGMAACIDDDLLDHFTVTADWDGLATGLVDRLEGTASRAVLYFAGAAWRQDPSSLARFGQTADALASAR